MEQLFFICPHCGNIVTKVKDSGVKVVCCGEEMKQLEAGVVDAAREKHIPTYEIANNILTVTVGSVEHPMMSAHYIEWIFVQTNQGSQLKKLEPNCKPQAQFALCNGEQVEAVYAYCNLHGLWKK